jgi:hypothetical protein
MTAVLKKAPVTVADELTYELLRDEWELLLTIGTGPTSTEEIVSRTGAFSEGLKQRLSLLTHTGLIAKKPEGYCSVPAIHQRQESMSSCLRDLVIRRLELGRELPLAGQVSHHLGTEEDVMRLIAAANQNLLPEVYATASPPATSTSKRYAIFFAVASHGPTELHDEEPTVVGPLLGLLKQAAIERAQEKTRGGSKLWIADVRTEMATANRIGELFSEFLRPTVSVASTGGMAGFAIIESGGN